MKIASTSSSFSCLFWLLVWQGATGVYGGDAHNMQKNFHSDVVRAAATARGRDDKAFQEKRQHDLRQELLHLATPLSEYQANKFDVNGVTIQISSHRNLEDQDEGGDDDFYVDYDDMYSFSGYSMKYAKCQPVQYFSQDAVEAGEHSPMVTEDIVILRLCPYQSCSQSAQYGCHYNYAEYALDLADYLAVMLKYSSLKRDYLCDYCENCGVEFQEDDQDEEEEDEEEDEQDDERRRRLEDADGDDQDDDADEEQDDDGNYYGDECADVDTYCYDYDNVCGDAEDENGNEYLQYEDYIDYLSCNEVEFNDYAYFVRPRCDGYKGTIKMAVYYDNYCAQYAGSDISVKNLGLGFRESIFQEYYNGTCIDCSENDYAPFYDTNSALCNKLHATGAKCTSDLLYDLFDGEDDDSTECSFIESIRFGTYDEGGKLSSVSSNFQWDTEVSTGQKIMLGVSIAFCFIFIVYACYLHHAMTNLLIKNLSHRELLPPSRHRQARLRGKKVAPGNDDDSDV